MPRKPVTSMALKRSVSVSESSSRPTLSLGRFAFVASAANAKPKRSAGLPVNYPISPVPPTQRALFDIYVVYSTDENPKGYAISHTAVRHRTRIGSGHYRYSTTSALKPLLINGPAAA